MRNLGVIILMVGALILIYMGVVGTIQSNILLATGLFLIILGFVLQIILNKREEKKRLEEKIIEGHTVTTTAAPKTTTTVHPDGTTTTTKVYPDGEVRKEVKP